MRYFSEHLAKQDLTEGGQVEMTWDGEGAAHRGRLGWQGS